MKPFVYLTIPAFIALSPLLTVASDNAMEAASRVPTESPATGPRITFESKVFEFGKVASGDVVKHEYTFTNTGTETLEITGVRPGCGCTTSGNWDRTVEPGKTGKIPVELNSKGFGGDIKKAIQISCNDSSQTNIILEIKGNVWRPFDVSPSYAYFNFAPGNNERQTRVLMIKSHLDEPVTLSEPLWTNKNFEAVLKAVREGKEFELTISTAPPKSGVNSHANFEIKTSSHKTPVLSVAANAFLQQPLTISPTQITLPTSPLARPVKSTVTVRNNTTNSMSVSDLALSIPGADVSLKEMQPGKLFTASVNFPVGFAAPADQRVELSMKSTLPNFAVIKVPVVQISRKPAQVQVQSQRSALLQGMHTVIPPR
jgi:hypothetical protein